MADVSVALYSSSAVSRNSLATSTMRLGRRRRRALTRPRYHRSDFQGSANIFPIVAPLELAAPGFEMIDPRRDGVAIARRNGRGEVCRPHVIRMCRHVDFMGLRAADGMPPQHGPQRIVAVRETVCFDADGLARDALDGKPTAVDHRQNGVDHRSQAAFRNSAVADRTGALEVDGADALAFIRFRGSWLARVAFTSPLLTVPARCFSTMAFPAQHDGGKRRQVEVERIGASVRTDRDGFDAAQISQPDPPYSRASLLSISRHSPRLGMPTRKLLRGTGVKLVTTSTGGAPGLSARTR